MTHRQKSRRPPGERESTDQPRQIKQGGRKQDRPAQDSKSAARCAHQVVCRSTSDSVSNPLAVGDALSRASCARAARCTNSSSTPELWAACAGAGAGAVKRGLVAAAAGPPTRWGALRCWSDLPPLDALAPACPLAYLQQAPQTHLVVIRDRDVQLIRRRGVSSSAWKQMHAPASAEQNACSKTSAAVKLRLCCAMLAQTAHT